jgi:predicted PurR-regulated permease PerM
MWLPKLVALALIMLGTVVVVTEFTSLITWSFGRVGRFVINDSSRYQILYGQVAEWLEGHGIAVAGLWAEHFNVAWMIGLFRDLTIRMNDMLSFSVVMLTYVILGVLEVDTIAAKLGAAETGEFGNVLLTGATQTAAKFRRYMLVRTLMSVATGLLVWGFAAAVGLELAAEWGVIAFALNYIVFIGPLIATVFPTLFAIAQFGTLEMAVVVFVCLNLIQFIVGSYFEPRIAGGGARHFAVPGVVRRIRLDLPLGDCGRVHRRADRHRGTDAMRTAPIHPMDCRSAGRLREAENRLDTGRRAGITGSEESLAIRFKRVA